MCLLTRDNANQLVARDRNPRERGFRPVNSERSTEGEDTMIDVSFEINGRKVSPNRVGDALEKAILQEVADNVKKALSSVRCREHGERPRVKVKGRSLDSLSFEVEGCCQELIDAAGKKLK